MAWTKPTEDDLTATLSQREIDSRRASGGFADDVVQAIIARTVRMVRGKCAANPRCVLSPGEGEIPGSLLAAAMDFAAYDLLTRFSIPVSEDRRRKREYTQQQFDAVAKGELNVEAGDSATVEVANEPAAPSFTAPLPPRLLD